MSLLPSENNHPGDQGNWYGAFKAAQRENEKLRAQLIEQQQVIDAAQNFIKAKGSHPSEQAYAALEAAVKGLVTWQAINRCHACG